MQMLYSKDIYMLDINACLDGHLIDSARSRRKTEKIRIKNETNKHLYTVWIVPMYKNQSF